jgi:hypothetical protein
MAYVSIPKDLSKIKTKFILGLTKRQALCFGAAALVGVPLFFLARSAVSISVAAMLMIIVMLPFFLIAMYKKNGQPLEKVLQNVWRTKFLRPKIRVYKTHNLYSATAAQMKLFKEVHAIVTGKRK